METRTASSAAVSEVLNVNNYLVWKVQVRTYLIAQDLWDIVEATDECPNQEDDEDASKQEDDEATSKQEGDEDASKQEGNEAASKQEEAAEDDEAASKQKGDEAASKQEDDEAATKQEGDEAASKQEDDEAASKAWTRKNAMALHVIQISCEPRVCFVIRRISSAKIAWDTLKAIWKIDKSDYGMSLSILHVLKHFYT